MPTKLKQIVGQFQMVPDEMARYKQLLFLASKLPPLPQQDRIDDNKVKGCVSQVWVVGELQEGKLQWRADSDSQLTKGLAALLVQGLSDCRPEDVLTVDPAGIIDALGLKQKLTPSRNNGFLNMFRLMQQKSHDLLGGNGGPARATEAAAPAQAAAQAAVPEAQLSSDAAPIAAASNGAAAAPADSAPAGNGAAEAAAAPDSATPVQDSMRRKLQQALDPNSLDIADESSQHAGHVGSRMKAGYSGETHFNVKIVSNAFEGLNTVKRHRTVYGLLQEELKGTVHALSLSTMTPEEEMEALSRGDV
jgi:sulfur transfer protein SufE/stress-induced morphogen